MENNNKKRWIAAIIALLVFLVTTVTTGQINQQPSNLRQDALEKFAAMDESIISGTNAKEKIFVINVDGTIMPDDNNDYIVEKLKEAAEDPRCAGVVLHINSPGGSVYASEKIAKAIEEVRAADKPVYSAMQAMAASGGYYISAPTNKIFASNETFTGSIGVIMSGYSLEGLFEEYGIKEQNITSGKMKDAGTLGRDMSEEEKKYLQGLVDGSYERFVKIVAEGRNMSESEVKKLADGRIYDGAQAKANGLVDVIGDLDDALADMTETYGLTDPMVVEKEYMLNMFSKYFPAFNGKADVSKSNLQVIQETIKDHQMMPMYLYGGYHD